MRADFVKNKKLAICSAFLLCIILSGTLVVSVASAPLAANTTISNTSQSTLEQLTSQYANQLNALSVNVSQHIDSIAASLATRSEFTSLPMENGQVPSVLGAAYFSCGYGGSYFSTNGITATQVFGNIWSENGTFILNYIAVLDPATFQILNVTVYQPFSCPSPDSTTPSTLPQMSDYKIYAIQGASETSLITSSSASENVSSNVVNSVSNGSEQTVSPSYSNQNPQNKWSGYEYALPNYPTLSASSGATYVVPLSNTAGILTNCAICVWTGFETYWAGQDALYQGGWEGQAPWLGSFTYNTWVDDVTSANPNQEAIITTIPAAPGDEILIDCVYGVLAQNTINVEISEPGYGAYISPNWTPINPSYVPQMGDTIVETPELVGLTSNYVATLPKWSGAINQFDPMVGLPNQTSYYASYCLQYGNWEVDFLQHSKGVNETQFVYVSNSTYEGILTTYLTSS